MPALSRSIGLCALVLCACGDDAAPVPRYPFTFTAHTDRQPLEGVQIRVNDNAMGTTNAAGLLRLDLTGPEGAPVRVSATCPAGYRTATDAQVHNLRRVQSLDPAASARGIEVTFSCPPEHRNAVVVVRTHAQTAVPVLLDGREVARTDESGAAHLHLAMAPGMTFQVMLSTRFNELLQPRDPSRSFTLPDHDEVFVFDQAFAQQEPPRRRRPRRAAPPPAPRLPVRIPSHR